MPLDTPWPYPFWIAHRGAGKLAPENTLAAFRLGGRHGYRAYECDVKLSADGVPFLLHDATLERTTNLTGRAADRPWAELAQADAGGWHGREHAGEPPASLASVGAWCRRNGHALNIEIKPTPGDEYRTGEIVAAAAASAWHDEPVPPLLSSFQVASLEGARASAPSLPRALLLEALPDGWFATALRLGCVAVVADQALIDAPMVQQLHDAGLRALAYTVNEPDSARRLMACGIDGLITDAVHRFAPGVTDPARLR